MIFSQPSLKPNVFEYLIFPQLPSFCGIAACCGALGSILHRQVTENELHATYGVGLYTKLRAPADYPSDKFASLPRSGKGFSNWDVIRLLNAVLLDNSKGPETVILCGEDFVREVSNPDQFDNILDWLQDNSCHAIVHIVDHYALFAGTLQLPKTGEVYLLLADSSTRTGPLRSLALSEIADLARGDDRYGFILVSDKPIPRSLFELWTDPMTPPEIIEKKRFARIDKKR